MNVKKFFYFSHRIFPGIRLLMKIYLKKLIYINILSIILSLSFIILIFSIHHQFKARLIENILYSLPLYIVFVLRSKNIVFLLNKKGLAPFNKENFVFDLYLISCSFYCATLLSIAIQYNNNIDLRGWWLFYLYFVTLIGFIFALVYAGLALSLGHHRTYTLIYSLALMLLFSLISFFPLSIKVGVLQGYETFWLVFISALVLHGLICLTKLISNFCINRP